ncbi:MAG: hypothetical protein O7G30_04010, partial [Proteobacteria bacterium]|nr:hypothetical protein [Pseudomonadota bacterium]
MSRAICIAASLALLLGGEAGAFNLTWGDVEVKQLGAYGFTSGNPVLSFDSGNTNEMVEMFGYLGTASGVIQIDQSSFNVLSAPSAVDNVVTSQVRLNNSGASSLGLNANDLTIEYTFTLVDDPTVWDSDQFLWDVTINNLTGTDMNLVFYSYLNLQLDGDSADDLADASPLRILVSDPDSGKLFNWKASNAGADHFQVQAFSSVRDLLDTMTTAQDLPDAVAFSGDFAAALQYDIVVPANSSFTLFGMPLTIVPEPSVALLTM